MKMRYLDESQAFMQLDGYGVVCVNTGDHNVLMHARRQIHEFDHQLPADALTPAVGADMNAVLDAVLVAGRRAKIAESPESDNLRCVPGDDEGETRGALGIEPGGAVFRGEFDLRIHGGRGTNHLVINR